MNNIMKMIPVAGPDISDLEVTYITDAVKTNWGQKASYYLDKFEAAFAEYTNRRFAIATPNCTSALHLSLLSAGVKAGDEVILPDCTWIATCAPILYIGAKPIFVDIDEDNWCISYDAVKKAITNKTKAIIAVDLYGNMPNYNMLQKLATDNNIVLIEDAAESIGSKFQDKISGSFGDFAAFSFHGSKTMTTSEGGMFLTDNEEHYNLAMNLSNHGRDPSNFSFNNDRLGYKYRMSTITAALGMAQLERVDKFIAKKREIFKTYQEILHNDKNIMLNKTNDSVYNSYWMTTVIIKDIPKLTNDILIAELNNYKIATRPFFPPLTTTKAFVKNYGNVINPNARKISKYGINIPSALTLTAEDIAYVAQRLKEIIRKYNG